VSDDGYSVNNNLARVVPGALNPTSGTPQGSIKLGYDNVQRNTSGVVQEILFRTYEKMSEVPEKDILLGQVISESEEISKDQILQSFNNSILKELIDKDEDNIIKYIRVRVRIPEEHMSLDVTKDFLNAFEVNPGFNHGRGFGKVSIDPRLAEVLYPWFIMPYSSAESGGSANAVKPKLGDLVQVRYANPRKSWGYLLNQVESNEIKTERGAETEKTPAQAVEDLSSPIGTIFKADKGPVAEGPSAIANNGSSSPTIVFDDVIISKAIAPYLGAMFRDAAAQGINLSPLTSGWRVPYKKDSPTAAEVKALAQGKTNWNGQPYPTRFRVATQEEVRYTNCGPTREKDPGDLTIPSKNCRIQTSRPGGSSHGKGTAADIPLGFQSSKFKTSRPDLLTKQYRWLCLNAWKYGFIRTVKSERWHWEYRPGLNMFSIVPRDNPLWDGQFDKDTIYEE
jgi:hypothetical protein